MIETNRSQKMFDCLIYANHFTGWLKIKYPTRQYAISFQPVAGFKKDYWNCL